MARRYVFRPECSPIRTVIPILSTIRTLLVKAHSVLFLEVLNRIVRSITRASDPFDGRMFRMPQRTPSSAHLVTYQVGCLDDHPTTSDCLQNPKPARTPQSLRPMIDRRSRLSGLRRGIPLFLFATTNDCTTQSTFGSPTLPFQKPFHARVSFAIVTRLTIREKVKR